MPIQTKTFLTRQPQAARPAAASAPETTPSQSPSVSAAPDTFKPSAPRAARWDADTAAAYGRFVSSEAKRLVASGAEVDCADFAALMLKNFCAQQGLANPLENEGKWNVYTPGRSGGLPNVKGPNYFLSGVNADNLAKRYSKPVNDSNGNGIAGFNRKTGEVDVADLLPGDLLFYDWDHDGTVNHTVNVLDVAKDGTVTLAYGTYNNLNGEGRPMTWDALDLQPITIMHLKPGTEDYKQWLGAGNDLWGVHRFNAMPAKGAHEPVAPQPTKPEPVAPQPTEPVTPQPTEPVAPRPAKPAAAAPKPAARRPAKPAAPAIARPAAAPIAPIATPSVAPIPAAPAPSAPEHKLGAAGRIFRFLLG